MSLRKFAKLIIVSVVLTMVVAACGNGGGGGDDGAAAPPAAGGNGGAAANGEAAAGGERDFVEINMWYAYTWYTPDPWGDDMVSAHWGEMFNIHVNQSNPDANAMEVLMLMVTADDLPDVIWMDRNEQNVQLARMGLFVPINDLVEMVDNNWYNENISATTQAFFEIDGVNYIIPNWARQGPVGVAGFNTGGNDAWMITTAVWEAVGSPELRTFEDLYNYAVLVRDAGLQNSLGHDVLPMVTDDGGSFGNVFVNAIFRSMGGFPDMWWYTIKPDGTFGSNFRNSVFIDAVVEANRWFREGLFPITNFTNSGEEFLATLNTGRAGLMFYDHSQDDTNSFRRILRENDPGNSIELVTFIENGVLYIYPPAGGLPPSRIYDQHGGTLGWNGSFITTSAARPERIFEWLSWLLTPMGSIEMMFGPRGVLWEELDANGFPILLRPPGLMTAEERAEVGTWAWTLAGHANNVDNAKFAANNALPEQYRNWVETMQYEVFTPRRWITDEFALIALQIEPGSDLAIRRQQIGDHFEENFPHVIMAGSEAEARQMMDSMLAFAEALGLAEIETIYNERWVYNSNLQGGSTLRPPGTP